MQVQPLRVTLLAALLAVGACAAPGQRGEAKDGPAGDAAALVSAFGQICGRLERAEVARNAARFGFFSLRRNALSGTEMAPRPPETAVFVRPNPGRNEMLFHTEAQNCTLMAGGIDPAAVETEFGRYLAALGSSREHSVAAAAPEQVASIQVSGMVRPRQLALVTPRAVVAGGTRIVMFSIAESRTGERAVALEMGVPRAPAATPQQEPKDPLPARH